MNSIDTHRFSEKDISRLQNIFDLEEVADSELDKKPAQVQVPSQEQQTLLEKKAKTMLAPTTQLPWWATIVNENRERFHDCAIAAIKTWDCDAADYAVLPDSIWVVQLVMCGPTCVHLLRGDLRRPSWPCVEDADAVLDESMLIGHYDVSECRLVSAVDFTIPEGYEVVVLCDVQFVGRRVVCRSQPEAFDAFCAPWLRSAKKKNSGSSGRASKITKTIRQRLFEEFPWLTDSDFKKLEDTFLDDDDADGGHEPALPAPSRKVDMSEVEEQVYARVAAGIEEKREEWVFDFDDAHFYVTQPGGWWTHEWTGTGTDSAMMKPRAHVWREWAKPFGFPRQKQFMYTCHTERGANELAREWVRVGSHFYDIWMSGDKTYPDNLDDIVDYPDNLDFVSWASEVEATHDSWNAIMQVRSWRPRRQV